MTYPLKTGPDGCAHLLLYLKELSKNTPRCLTVEEQREASGPRVNSSKGKKGCRGTETSGFMRT